MTDAPAPLPADGPRRIEVSRRIAAPAARIFAVITDPNGQVAIDGSGMLVAAHEAEGNAKVLTAVGDRFDMDMDREPLGDVPMGRYEVENVVTAIVADTQLEWLVGTGGRTPIGHVYGYLLDPVSETETDVTNYCDWSGVSEKWLTRFSWPVVPPQMLARSLENLARIVEQ